MYWLMDEYKSQLIPIAFSMDNEVFSSFFHNSN